MVSGGSVDELAHDVQVAGMVGCSACTSVACQGARRRLVRADAEIGVVIVRVDRQSLGHAAECLAEPASSAADVEGPLSTAKRSGEVRR